MGNQKNKSMFLAQIMVIATLGIMFGTACSASLKQGTTELQMSSTPTNLLINKKTLPTPIWSMAEISPAIYGSYNELAYWNDIALIGVIESKDSLFLPREQDHEYEGVLHTRFQVARIYQVKVDEYLKGDGPTNILVAQPLNFNLLAISESAITDEYLEKVIQNNGVEEPLDIGTSYLMFVIQRKQEWGGITPGSVYSKGGFPWHFDASDLQVITVQGVYAEALAQKYPPQTLAEIVEKINQPYPEPTKTPEPLEAYPYPP